MNKKIIEKVKTSESTISMVLGIVVVAVVGVLLFNYFKGMAGKLISQPNDKEAGATEISPIPEKTEGLEIQYKGELPAKYVVTQGDTLWKISQKFYGSGYNWVDISAENKLSNPNILIEGQELTIPKAEPIKPIVSEKSQNIPFGAIEGDKYEIQKGDTLWKISVRAYQDGYKWPQIAKANNISNPNIIHPGNILTIPR